MPDTATITAFYSFTPGTVIQSAKVNTNFSNFRGHIVPIDPNTSTAATSGAYDLGASDHYWRAGYFQALIFSQNAASYTAPAAGFNSIYFKSDGKAYSRNSGGTETALGSGSGQLDCTGTGAAGITITAAGLTYNTAGSGRQMHFLRGDTTSGTDITANPQISNGSTVGQELILVGTDDSRPVILDDGTGLKINGPMTLYQYSTISLVWDGTLWAEMYRRV